jgi:cobalt-zinc-cadmium resistance protein CzcA
MIARLIEFALSQRLLVIGAALMLASMGLYAFEQLDIEAYPDPVQPMVEVLVLPEGLSAEEVEKIVTVPLEIGFGGMSNLERITSTSLFGLCDVKCYFSWKSDYFQDRIQTINHLSFVHLAQNLTPFISPENPVGEIYRYTVEVPGHDLLLEKELEDWVVAKQLKTVPGVIDVVSFGGLTKEYHVDVDPQKLDHYGVPLATLVGAIRNSNVNVGGNYLTIGEQTFNVRGVGFIHSLRDIAQVQLTSTGATPITVGNVANVSVGYAPRLGMVGIDGRSDVAEGIVLMRKYGNTLATLRGVKAQVESLNHSGILPQGAVVRPYYDRTGLIETTVRTVTENLLIGMVLVFLVLLFFLCDLRAAAITAVNIPLALLAAAILMLQTGTPANLMSLGAIDFGIIVDSTVIVVENIYRHLEHDRSIRATDTAIRRAGREVGGPIMFSTMIFIVAFLPLFTMRAMEGAIFSPMSHVYAYALGAGILLAVTLSPVLSSLLLRPGRHGFRNPIWEAMQQGYHRLFVVVLRRPGLSLVLMVAAMVAGLAQFSRLGGEFLPHLEEGNILVHVTMPRSISFNHGAMLVQKIRLLMRSLRESSTVVSQFGRPDDGTDPVGFDNADILMELQPASRWRPGLTKDDLVAQLDGSLRRKFPGVDFDYTQFVEDRVQDVMSGIKGANSIKVFGPDLATDEAIADRVARAIAKVDGIVDVVVNRSMGKPNLVIRPDRAACARYGLTVGDVAAIIEGAIGGETATQVLQGDRSFALVVRWLPQYRQSHDAIAQIRVPLPGGGRVPLAQVADIQTSEGASFIYRESFRRYVPVSFAVRGRDLKTAVEAANARIAADVRMPAGVQLEWGGEYGEMQAALARLAIMVPAALLIITGLLYAATHSWTDTIIIMAQIPVACLGGILALIVTGKPFSVSAAVGFISIFGIAVTDGILLSSYIRQLWDDGMPFVEAIVQGSDRRFRAVIMTALVDGLGLLPAAMSQKIGAQPQKPLAIVVIGGVLAIAALTRLLQPVLIYLLHGGARMAAASQDTQD